MVTIQGGGGVYIASTVQTSVLAHFDSENLHLKLSEDGDIESINTDFDCAKKVAQVWQGVAYVPFRQPAWGQVQWLLNGNGNREEDIEQLQMGSLG